ncbi:MAG TPA: hypothetical protein VHO70_20185 [Chitinispirillaceae bacterium]|nr:hypothetical protein [Chitinispirillaceae bacterium]
MKLSLKGIVICASLFSISTAAYSYDNNSDYINQIETTFSTVFQDWEHQVEGEYLVENNVWNKGQTKDYIQKIGIKKGRHGAVKAGWGWSWPGSPVITAFPDVMFGKNPWAESSTTPRLPVQISKISALYADLKAIHLGNGHRNTAFQIWLTADPVSRPEHIRHEIMIWLRNDGLPLAPNQKEMEIKGEKYTLSVMKDFGDPQLNPPIKWDYCSFLVPKPFMEGRVDIKAFLDFLIEDGLVSPHEYVAVINLGNEIRDGEGLTVLESYKITVDSN